MLATILSLFGLDQNESTTESQDRLASPPGRASAKAEDGRSEEVRRLKREVENLKGRLEEQGADAARLRGEREKLMRDYEHRGNRVARLEHEIGQMRHSYQEDVQRRTQHIQAVEERLKQTEELLATRSAELAGAQAFLSTTDRLSEVEVLSIVRDLNENIYQVAVSLTEEWEKLESVPTTSQTDADATSQPHVPALVQLVRNRDPTGLTFLLQSCLCSQVVNATSSWDHFQELAILESIHQRLSASEGQAISARWRSLTHSYLSKPPPHSAWFAERLANVLYETGSFSSAQQSLDFVQVVALRGIERIIKLLLRLESAFMVEVTSSDMFLLFETPGAVFDDARMTDEFGPGGASTPGEQDGIAATTEVGVGKNVSEGSGKARHTEILLKTKVVLEKDIVEL